MKPLRRKAARRCAQILTKVQAMGLPKDMRVFGFGLSLERPTMIKYGISNIRELLGHQVDLNFIQKNPAVRLDKE
jgi:phenylalanyl-tRNA synthetase alpha chain